MHEAAAAGIGSAINHIAVPSGGIRIDNYRLINVLFSDLIKPLLANLGGTLTRAQVDRGEKSDAEFWKSVETEYNDKEKIEYGELAHDVKWPGTKPSSARLPPPD
jgi:hypothetical protein